MSTKFELSAIFHFRVKFALNKWIDGLGLQYVMEPAGIIIIIIFLLFFLTLVIIIIIIIIKTISKAPIEHLVTKRRSQYCP